MILFPDGAENFAEMWKVTDGIGFSEEVLEEQDDILLGREVQIVFNLFIVVEFAVQELCGLDELCVFLQQLFCIDFPHSIQSNLEKLVVMLPHFFVSVLVEEQLQLCL